MSAFQINPQRRTWVCEIGVERSPLVRIDDFFLAPDSLIAAAVDSPFIEVGPMYPGVRAPVPSGYLDALLTGVAEIMQEIYGAHPEPELELCAFSLVTTAPDKLKPLQQIPHYDGPERSRYAFLHYLCAPHFGGTSFYCHRSTGFESVTPERLNDYSRVLQAELASQPPTSAYINGDSALFERTHSIDAAFNRLLIYRGNQLHSGNIPPGLTLPENPRTGRLTINGFGHLNT